MQTIVQVMVMSAVLPVLVGQSARGEGQDNREDLSNYLAGRYIVIGREMNSDKTSQGIVTFVYEKGRLSVTQKIRGRCVKGEGRIEHAPGPDKADVLRVRFVQGQKGYEVPCRWQRDLDIYPGLSGYLYQSGKKTDAPGMEVLFRGHAQEWSTKAAMRADIRVRLFAMSVRSAGDIL